MNPPDILSFETYKSCSLCPRTCHADRYKVSGFCGCSDTLMAARAALHHWEEPCISGPSEKWGGSGTVFFSGCTLGCCYCQNHRISSGHFGRELTTDELAGTFLRLQDQGALNINLVTPTQYLPHIVSALDQVRSRLTIPVVYNCGGYERVETVKALKDYVDIWLPDFKYYDNRLAFRYSRAKDYFETAAAAIRQMTEQTGGLVYREDNTVNDFTLSGNGPSPSPAATSPAATPATTSPAATSGLMAKGVIIRHMVLPGHRDDSMAILSWMKDNLPQGQFLISLMSQYTPYIKNEAYPELNRRITSYEYNKVVDFAIDLGFTDGFMQKKSSAREEYTPPFDLEGL